MGDDNKRLKFDPSCRDCDHIRFVNRCFSCVLAVCIAATLVNEFWQRAVLGTLLIVVIFVFERWYYKRALMFHHLVDGDQL